MSNLRIFGLILGIIGLLTTFLVYRGPKWKRANFVLLALFNVSLILVVINPDILNSIRDVLSLRAAARGRILALLVMSNLFLLFYTFFTKLRVEKIHFQFDRLVRTIGSKAIEETEELSECIKPIMILMPAYNEADNLKELLPRLPEQIGGTGVGVLVIDDGSEDRTFSVAEGFPDVCAVKNPINRGGGAALRLGYDILKKAGADYCVTMDADGQHRPEDLEALLKPIIEEKYDFVIGSRILGTHAKGSLFRLAGVYFFSSMISLLLGKKITDPSSGFRAFKMKAVAPIDLYEDQYHTSELIIEAVKKGLRVGEMPITILKRKYGKSKKGHDLAYGFHFAKIIFKTWWR